MATKKNQKTPLTLIAGKAPTVVSVRLCMDSDAFSELGVVTQEKDEAEARLAGLRARQHATEGSGVGGMLDVQIAEAEAELEESVSSMDKSKARAKLSALKAREITGAAGRLKREIVEAEAALEPIVERHAAALAVADAATVEFKCRALPQKVVRALLLEHPPTEEMEDEWEKEVKNQGAPEAVVAKGLQYNLDTYPPALIARCLVVPKMTEEEVIELIWTSDNWNETEKQSLFQLALVAQQSVPLAR